MKVRGERVVKCGGMEESGGKGKFFRILMGNA